MAELIGGKKVLYKYFFYVMDLTLVVNHKHLYPVQRKNECRLTLVIIRIP